MKRLIITFSLAALLAAPTVSMAQDDKGRNLAGLAFESIDTAERGFVDMGEFLSFGGDIFVSMDADESNHLSLEEFTSWDYGMLEVAQDRGREQAYEAALRIVFAFWDRDGSGEVSRTEHRQSLSFDFQRADTNGDALLDKPEFFGGFTVMVALQAALVPNL